MPGGEAADHGAVAITVPPECSDCKGRDEDVEAGGGGGEAGGGWTGEVEAKLCRICHLGSDGGAPEGSELIQLGCACKGELGDAHRPCAEAWFRIKGNRCCEICGVNVKNISGQEDIHFMEIWHERRMLGRGNRDSSETTKCCEICGVNVKNISGQEDIHFMEIWHERRMLGRGNRDSSETTSCWRNQPFCNFLILCLVIAFVLPWFFHVNVL